MTTSPPFKLHWSPKSPYVRKVMVVAHELAVADRLELVRSVAIMSSPNPSIMADNPLNKIPTLVLEDGTALYDSRVICEYLDSLAEESMRLYPADGAARWRSLTWQSLGDGALDALILWRNEREKPTERQTDKWLEAFAFKTTAVLDVLERLAPSLTATRFSIGHVAIGCMLSYLDFRFAHLGWRTTKPALAHWHSTFCERPSARLTEISDG